MAKNLRTMKMSFFSVKFHYPGPYVNYPGPNAETGNAWAHDLDVEKALTASGLDFRHEYSWPDGSCYKYIRSDLTADRLRERLVVALTGSPYLVERIRELEPGYRVDDGRSSIQDVFEKTPVSVSS